MVAIDQGYARIRFGGEAVVAAPMVVEVPEEETLWRLDSWRKIPHLL